MMEAGRELDELVARHVFGVDVDAVLLLSGEEFATFPTYSTNIEVAWHVVEKLTPQDGPEELWWDFKLERYSYYRATFFDVDSGTVYGLAEEDTASHAICRAALKANGFDLTS